MNIELKITLWALASGYALGNSFIYSWTFWTAFDINILQFASLTDIIPSIIYNLILPFIAVALSVILAESWVKLQVRIERVIDEYLSMYIKNYEKIKFYSRLITSFIFAVGALIAAVYSAKATTDRFPSGEIPWLDIMKLFIPMFSTLIITYIVIEKTPILSGIKYRRILLFCLCIIPLVSYLWAKINSDKILKGKNTFIVKSDTQCKSTPETEFRYISSISDKAFALSLKDGSICIFKYNNLELIPESKKVFERAIDSKML
ncbi:TPA: hypothetical protein ACPY1R_002214 [Enterobacter hormaechei subsp. xiangfangensis]|uniref:hypothetical protein n=1 Tax=Enterobacter hormaechei TaxID=158836 RepID=UPI0013D618D1|nr:hypothetical protein [Enterobacter hormaechei]HDS5193647.1 hypothetical protein [Enterobacter hormaechei subsp. steigerwaltii]EHF4929183.1 hypothetical protein [Enterobacter hormaechei]MCR4208445.1 hypothetical protein [Enterobacter hormaechei]MDS0014648.1 hypothetical protein [Enterobacter hormaechei subsp. xiangfangensis]MDS0057676.1 hypothetical protein [Enterobacter hormaechei subsp. xiangfangensis]